MAVRLQISLAMLLMSLCFYSAALHAELGISIVGATPALEENILAHIGKLDNSQLADQGKLSALLNKQVQIAAKAMGYYQAKVQIEYKAKSLQISISPGDYIRYLPASIEVQGTAANFLALSDRLLKNPMLPGTQLLHPQYDAYKKSLLSLLLNSGFLDARFTQSELRIDKEAKTAAVYWRIDSGPRYKIGSIQYSESKIIPDLLKRLTPLQTGDYVSSEKLLDLRRNFLDSKYFKSVNVQQVKVADAKLNLILETVDASKHQYDMSVGFSTDTGPRVGFGWEQPMLNQYGHSSAVNTRVSAPEQEVSGSYKIPLYKAASHYLQIDVCWQSKDIEDTVSEKTSIGALVSETFPSDWRFDYSVNLDYENYTQGSEDTKTVTYLLPGISFSRTLLAPGIDPMHGNRYWFGVSGSSEKLGSDEDFIRLFGLGKWLFDLGNDNTLLLTRLELGLIATADIQALPSSQRFFTGGDQSVRGYNYESLAPKDTNGELIGGKYLNVASIELSQRIAASWRLAFFVDSGRSYNDSSEPFNTGVGTGVRWLSPIGQVRIDLAFPVNNEETGFKLHISMGPAL